MCVIQPSASKVIEYSSTNKQQQTRKVFSLTSFKHSTCKLKNTQSKVQTNIIKKTHRASLFLNKNIKALTSLGKNRSSIFIICTSWSIILHLPAETEIVACLREIIKGVTFDNSRTFVSGDIILPKVAGLSGKSRTLFGQTESFFPLTGTVFRRCAICSVYQMT